MRHCDSDRFELLSLAAAVVDAESLDAEPTADNPKGASTLSEKIEAGADCLPKPAWTIALLRIATEASMTVIGVTDLALRLISQKVFETKQPL